MKLFKLAFAVTLILCCSCGFAVEVFTAADLAEALTTSPDGTTVTLGADIDCTGWTTVDSFSGTLDGQGYKIENLDAPFFGVITGDIAISNLVVKGANVTASAETSGILLKCVTNDNLVVENVTFTGSTLRMTINKGNMGFVVGLFSVTGMASFKDCHVDNTCSFALGVNQHGGIAGNGTATGTGATISFTHCTMAATLSTTQSHGSQFGGIAGNLSVQGGGRTVADYAHLIMDSCTNYSGTGLSVWTGSNRSFGGLIHTAAAGNSTHMGDAVIRNCANYGSFLYDGKITSSGTNYGGLLGCWNSGPLTMENCVNYGDILSTGDGDTVSAIGGLVGYIIAPIQVEVSITGCANIGDITGCYAGGLVGYLTHNASYVNTKIFIRSCLNTGTVTVRKEGVSPGEAICQLRTGVAYPRIDIEGGFYTTDALIGTYAEGASVTTFGTIGNVFPGNSDGLVDGTDLATLNDYDNCGLWKQGHEHPILKIMPDEAAPDTIVATFEDWDGTILKQKTVARGGYVLAPADPARDGCTFLGWNPAVLTGLTADTTFTAQYSSGIVTHTVAFFDWDGTQIGEDQEVGHGEAATPPANPSREGYIFVGWDTAFDNVTEDLAVHASYVLAHVHVATAADFATAVTAETVPGVTVHLDGDVELPADWTAPDFRATLDGAGHSILCPNGGLPIFNHLYGCASNFVIDAASEGVATKITLGTSAVFGTVANILAGGAIRDVTVENLVLQTGSDCTVGFIAGKMVDGAAIERCLVADSCTFRQTRTNGAGGIVGVIDRTVDFTPTDGEGNPVTGETLALVADCTNRAPVVVFLANPLVSGGIVGKANVHNATYQPAMKILRCVNEADFTATVNNGYTVKFGGIIGERNVNETSVHGGVLWIVDCVNLGDICSPSASGCNLGGIVGFLYRGCETVLAGCVNRGDVGSAVAGDGTTPVTGNVAGGLVGFLDSLYNNNSVTATNCANYGAVTGGKYAGGFIGGFNANQGHPSTILMFYNCANYGALSAPAEGGLTGEIFARFETDVADSPSRQYGAVNSFFMTKDFCADTSGSAIITNGLVTAADVGYTPSAAKKTLNIVANESGYEPWVLGRIGEGDTAFVAPELECFMTKKANPGFTIIIK
ncbi:MAG: InlB B-repeat-containing protein [Kiritimatiellae bacterium]|nr:InlB B-repeat-containing protein [Kiritimatiellia bacterium]